MNFVFVDIDGVLNTPGDYARWRDAPPESREESLFNPALVARLNLITSAASAQIVVSSSWRLYYCDTADGRPFAELRDLLERVGVTAPIVGPTPVCEPLRWAAIEKWIKDADRWTPAKCGHFVVLDDDVPHDDWCWKMRHVHCRSLPGGLTDENVEQAIRLLTESAYCEELK